MNLIRQVVNGWEKSTVFTWLFFFQSFNCHIIDVKVVAKNDKIKFHTHQTFHNIHDDNFTCKCVLFIWESWGQQLAEIFMHKIHLPLGKNLPWTVNAAGNMHHLLVACYTGLSETGCWPGGWGGVAPPQVLADQLILSQLWGGRSCPPNGYLPPPSGFSDLPTALLYCLQVKVSLFQNSLCCWLTELCNIF